MKGRGLNQKDDGHSTRNILMMIVLGDARRG